MLFGFLSRGKKLQIDDEVHFESVALPLTIASSIMSAVPERNRNLVAIRNLLTAIPKAQKETLVDRVVHRFLLYVMDTPGSEKSHHARPFGLLDHSLEVARLALERAQDQRFTTSHDPVVNHGMQPRWIYGVFVAALLRDIGMVTEATVPTPDGSVWDPLREPLAAFYRRHGLAPGDHSRFRHRADRAVEDGPGFFFSAILPIEARDYLGAVQSYLLLPKSEPYALMKTLWSHTDDPSTPEAKPAPVVVQIQSGPIRLEKASPIPSTPSPREVPAASPRAVNNEAIDVGAEKILNDIRNALKTGVLGVNIRNADIYLSATHAHIVLPVALDKIARLRGYPVFPSDELDAYLSVLGRHPLVEHRPGGEVLHDVLTTSQAAKPVHTLRVKLVPWLSQDEIDRYGLWDQALADAAGAR